MKIFSCLAAIIILISCGGSERNFDVESVGGYSFLVQIPLDQYIESLTEGYTDPGLKSIIEEAGNPTSTTPKEYFKKMVELAENKDYDLPKYLNKANPELFNSSLKLNQLANFLLDMYENDLNECWHQLAARYQDIECQYNLFKAEEGRFRVEFDRTIDRIDALNLIFKSSNLEFYEVLELGQLTTPILDIEDALVGRDSASVNSSEELLVLSGEEMLNEAEITGETQQMSTEEIEKQYPITSRLQLNFNYFKDGTMDYETSEMNPMIGFALNSDTAFLSSIFKDPEYSTYLPKRAILSWDEILDEHGMTTDLCGLYALREAEKFYRILPEEIERAECRKSDLSEEFYDILIYFKGEGISKWSSLTASNVNEYLAIVLDDDVLSVPMVQQRIMGGECVISGAFDETEAKKLSRAINSSHLAFPLSIVEETIY